MLHTYRTNWIRSVDRFGTISVWFVRNFQTQKFHSTPKNVLIVEDIIDTGRTMKKLLQLLETYGLKSLKVTSLVVKRKGGEIAFMPDCKSFDYNQTMALREFACF